MKDAELREVLNQLENRHRPNPNPNGPGPRFLEYTPEYHAELLRRAADGIAERGAGYFDHNGVRFSIKHGQLYRSLPL